MGWPVLRIRDQHEIHSRRQQKIINPVSPGSRGWVFRVPSLGRAAWSLAEIQRPYRPRLAPPPLFPKPQIPQKDTFLAPDRVAEMFLLPVPIPPTGGGLMSGRRVQHLVARGKSFQVRLYVPVDLQPVLDRRELRWSVRTREP